MTNKSRTTYSFLNIFTGVGGYIINTVLGLVCRMVFTRTLATDYLGINGLFSNILTMLSLAELGIGPAIVFALYKPLAINDEEKIATLVNFYGKCYRIIGCVVAIFGLAVMPFLNLIIKDAPDISENLYVIYSLYLFNTASTYFFSYRSSLLSAAQKNYLVVGLNYVITIIQSIIQMGILFLTHNYILYLIIQAIGTLIYNVTISSIAKKRYSFIVKKDIKPLEKEEKASLFKNIKSLVIIKLSGMLVNNTDNIIITYFSGLATVGLSSNYILLSSTINSLLNQIFNGINASVGNHNAVEAKEKRKFLFDAINFANFWFFGWAAIGIFVVSTDIVSVLFGSNYILTNDIPFVLALNFYIVGMQNAVWTYKNTLGLFKYGRYLLFFTAAINLVLSILLGQKYGLFGIYLATSISKLLTNTWYDPYAVFKYGLMSKPINYFKKYILYLVILFATGALCYYVCSLYSFTPIINAILKFITCCIIPNTIFALCFFKTKEFKYLLNILETLLKKLTIIKRIKKS